MLLVFLFLFDNRCIEVFDLLQQVCYLFLEILDFLFEPLVGLNLQPMRLPLIDKLH